MARDSQAREADGEASLVDRRSVLKSAGLVATSAVASGAVTGSARAATSSGFGEREYGAGSYGGSSTESTLAVSTLDTTNVTSSAATLNGEVTDLGGASSANVAFEYRWASDSTWTKTSAQTLSSTGSFSATIDGLSSGADYEFRAVVSASDGDTATGTTRTFTTQSASNLPAIDRFGISEAGSPNPHAEISALWQVSDADSDLQTVEITVTNPTGKIVDSATTSVSGQSVSGSDSFTIKHGGGLTYDCTLTVTDAESQTASQTKSVTA